MAVRLFVGNLSADVTAAELKTHFSAVGPVAYLSLPTDRETGKSRLFAFVEFAEQAHAEAAINQFNNQIFKGRPLSVSEARAREERRPLGAPAPRPAYQRAETSSSDGNQQGPPARSESNRNFGPDATPQRRPGKGMRSERIPKGPLREKIRGQFFGDDGDDDDDDDFNEDNFNEENFDSQATEAESDDQP